MAIDLSNFDTSAFAETVAHQYQIADNVGNDKTIFRTTAGSATMKVPVFTNKTASFTADGALLGINSTAEQSATIPDFDPIIKHEFVPYSDIENNAFSVPVEYAKNLARSVATARTKVIQLLMASAATSASRTVDVGGAGTPTAALVQAAVEEAAGDMTAKGVPFEGRYMLLKSAYYYKLLGSEAVANGNWGGNGNNNDPQSLQYAHFTIMPDDSAAAVDATGDTTIPSAARFNNVSGVGVAWHDDAFAIGHKSGGDITTTIDDSPERNSVLVKARLHMGAVAVLPSGGIICITDNGA